MPQSIFDQSRPGTVDTTMIEDQSKEISSKEEELMRKAKDLENEMMQIKQAKIDVVVKQFE